jgi:hypothetical protein
MKPKFAWRTVRKMIKEVGAKGTAARAFAWRWGYHYEGMPHGKPYTLRPEQRAATYGTEVRGAPGRRVTVKEAAARLRAAEIP